MRERKKEGERDFNLGRKVWMKHIRYFFVLFLQLFCKCETMIILNVKKESSEIQNCTHLQTPRLSSPFCFIPSSISAMPKIFQISSLKGF